jgi:hypothetical protein
MVAKDAESHVIDLLVSSGVELRVWRLPSELFEPKFGPAVSWDDVLDFHDLLATDDWFDRLLELVHR